MKPQLKKDEALLFFRELKTNPGEIKIITHTNEFGVLWEKYWVFENDKFKSKVCLPGVRCVGWHEFSDGEAIKHIHDDFRIIKKR